jgi:hypothetical protein
MLPGPVDDPLMRKLVALVQEQLPNSAHRARVHLLERLYGLEGEALKTGADPRTLLAIRSTQHFILRSAPLIDVQATCGRHDEARSALPQ